MVVKRLGQTLRRMVGGGKQPLGSADFQDLRLKFREFKYLLRANNEVLSIIAEIETRLEEGGVGLDFIHSRYIAASAKVYKMIRHLNRISSDRYTGLLPSFDLIRHNIDDVLSSGGAAGEGELVLPLLSVERDQGHLVGSKAGNLAQIWRSGHPICDGFVITTDVFRRFMQHTGLGGQLRQAVMLLEDPGYPDLLQMSRRIQERVRSAPLPPEVEAAIDDALGEFYDRQGEVKLSLRSSAIGEDSETSFAGQYTSVLGVSADEVLTAYREVVASLYSPQAIVYRRKNGMRDEDAEMAVLAQRMLEPTVSGVMYTRDPLQGEQGPLLISAVYGLGLGLVDGSVTPDVFSVHRRGEPRLSHTQLGAKANRVVGGEGGNRREKVPPELAGAPALEPGQVVELARLGLSLEKEFGRPQDVEWALAGDGGFFILQSRPLQLLEPSNTGGRAHDPGIAPLVSGGQTARPGAGSGPAYLVRSEEDLAGFPDGAVLVTRHSSPAFAAVLHRASAVVTDVGGVTGHMASLAREFGIPALVGAAGATKAIPDGQVITVDAGARRVYPGRVEQLLEQEELSAQRRRVERIKPGWYRAAQLITPLTLTDPRSPGFSPGRCVTFHDLIRFVHEKSFQEMFLLGEHLGQAASTQSRRVAHKLPFELWVIDLGGGLREGAGPRVSREDFASAPGRAFMEGLLDPRVEWDRPRPINVKGLASVFSAALINPPPDNGKVRAMGERAYAIISADYMNFNSRVGYHFAALDCFCGPNQNDNYISFRFSGGAADEDRRNLRCELIGRILADLGFEINQTGDVVSAFLKKYEQEPTKKRLGDLARLILFTRQMDMLTSDRRMVDWLAEAFRQGNFNLETSGA